MPDAVGPAIKISKELNGEIINADSMQIYKELNIISARPTPLDIKKVNHHLYGYVSGKERFNVEKWCSDAVKKINTLIYNNISPIFVGGTGLYFRALLNGLSPIPQIPEEIRDFANSCDLSFFLDGLNKNNPDILEKIDINNRRRVQRAWEVLEATGKSLLYWQSKNKSPLISVSNATLLLVELDNQSLANRISNRVNHMLEYGVIKEVEKVYNTCWDKKLPYAKAIGAEDIVSYLNGEIKFEKLSQNIALKTRQFGKRQRTWQRNFMKDWDSINTAALNRLDIKRIVKKVNTSN